MKPLRSLGFAFLMTGLTLVAFAADPPAGTVRQACHTDFATLCKGITPGGGALKKCIKQNYRKLSPDCKAALKARRKQKAAAAGS